MKVAMLKKSAVEGVKHASGLYFRQDAKSLLSLSQEAFWDYQKDLFTRRYLDAARHVRHYRESADYPSEIPVGGNVLDSLEQLPLLNKGLVKENAAAFIRQPRNPFAATHTTGGTTGTPLKVTAGLFERGWTNAILEQRNRLETGSLNPRTLRLTGFLTDSEGGIGQRLPLTNMAYLSIYSLSGDRQSQLQNFVNEFRPQLLHGYPSALMQFARFVQPATVPNWCAEVAISTSETLSPSDRDALEDRLGIPVLNEYGSQEGQHLMFECRKRSMHIHPARGIVEILNFESDVRVGIGETGRVVVTGLLAREMPLIRYDIGDTAVSTGYASNCQCGLSWPTVGAVYGRLQDLIRTRDGRRIGHLSGSTLKDAKGVRESQIVQTGYESFVYRILLEAGASREELERHVRRQLSQRLGFRPDIAFEYLKKPVERTPSGKMRSVVVDF